MQVTRGRAGGQLDLQRCPFPMFCLYFSQNMSFVSHDRPDSLKGYKSARLPDSWPFLSKGRAFRPILTPCTGAKADGVLGIQLLLVNPHNLKRNIFLLDHKDTRFLLNALQKFRYIVYCTFLDYSLLGKGFSLIFHFTFNNYVPGFLSQLSFLNFVNHSFSVILKIPPKI